MTKELLRWEDSPGLGELNSCCNLCWTIVADDLFPEHHCPKCQTPLNNPRAKHTCYFKHVEICPLFHLMMQRRRPKRVEAKENTTDTRKTQVKLTTATPAAATTTPTTSATDNWLYFCANWPNYNKTKASNPTYTQPHPSHPQAKEVISPAPRTTTQKQHLNSRSASAKRRRNESKH
jgi:hypothetical protein